MAEQLPSMLEESTADFTAPYPPTDSYRESIRSVAWPEWRIRSTLSSLSDSGQSGSNYSSDSGAFLSCYFSDNSGYSYSSSLGSAGETDFHVGELTKIAKRMVSDGYTQRMVQAFRDGGGQDRALHNWFVELDVDWVLEIHGIYGLRWQLQLMLQDTSTSWLQELIEKWIRALTIIVSSIKEELVAQQDTLPVARLGKASITAMLVFLEVILDVFKVVNLQPVLHMYVCISNASYDMSTMHTHSLIASETQSIFTEIGASLVREETRLIQVISTTTKVWMSRMTRYYYICSNKMHNDHRLRGGEVHKNTQLMVDYIVLMRKVQASVQNYSQGNSSGILRELIDDLTGYLKNLLWKSSELCSDLSLKYLFLLNNFYFIVQVSEPSLPLDVELSFVHHP